MGQKVNPHGARVGVIFGWSGRWYAGKKDFANYLVEDNKLRKMLKEKLNQAGISHIDLQRAGEKLHIIVYTAKPGIVIGQKGSFFTKGKALSKEIKELSDKYGLDIDPDKTVYEMSVGEKQTLEIIKVLYRGAKILIMDEPTAVLTPQEIKKLFTSGRPKSKIRVVQSGCSFICGSDNS